MINSSSQYVKVGHSSQRNGNYHSRPASDITNKSGSFKTLTEAMRSWTLNIELNDDNDDISFIVFSCIFTPRM